MRNASDGVLVFGSINIDLVCRADRIPKAGETILAPSYEFFAGGKGANQAVAAARSGAQVKMIAAVGNDAFAAVPTQALKNAGVDIQGIRVVDAPTGAAFITVSQEGENAITVASGANRLVRAEMIGEKAWSASRFLLMQGELAWGETVLAAQMAKAHGLAVILNAAPSQHFDGSIMSFVDYLIINAHEIADIGARHGVQSSEPRAFAERILSRPESAVVITRGSEGVQFCGGSEEFSIAAQPVEVIDTTGAGDTFCGVFVSMLAQGRDRRESVQLANVAAGLACTQKGAQTAMPAWADIEAAMRAIKS